MTMIAIYGASDDLVEIEIDGKPWEELSEPRSFVFTAAGKALHVDVEHCGKRGWKVTTVLEDESESGDLPFLVSLHQRHYSPLLLVQATAAHPVTFTWWDEDKKPRTKTIRGGPTDTSTNPTPEKHGT